MQLVAGRFLTVPDTLVDGQPAPPLLDVNGRLVVSVSAGTIVVTGASTPGDALPNPTTNVPVTGYNEIWNGATWDRASGGAVDATHAAPALGAGNARSHLYSRRPDGTWIAALGANTAGSISVSVDDGILRITFLNTLGSNVQPRANQSRDTMVVPSVQNPADTAGDPSLSNTVDDNAVTVKASAGWLLSALVCNEGVAGYFQIFNKASDPVGADVPVLSIPMGAGTAGVSRLELPRELLAGGKRFATGIAVGWSSTRASYTAAAFTGVTNVLFS